MSLLPRCRGRARDQVDRMIGILVLHRFVEVGRGTDQTHLPDVSVVGFEQPHSVLAQGEHPERVVIVQCGQQGANGESICHGHHFGDGGVQPQRDGLLGPNEDRQTVARLPPKRRVVQERRGHREERHHVWPAHSGVPQLKFRLLQKVAVADAVLLLVNRGAVCRRVQRNARPAHAPCERKDGPAIDGIHVCMPPYSVSEHGRRRQTARGGLPRHARYYECSHHLTGTVTRGPHDGSGGCSPRNKRVYW